MSDETTPSSAPHSLTDDVPVIVRVGKGDTALLAA